MQESISSYLTEKANLIQNAFDLYLPKTERYPSIIYESMRYSLLAGGKRIRPILVLTVAETVGLDPKQAMPFACAIEMIHTYSLIHDDLPAMDNDDYRRGNLTNHKVYGDGLAILAGDALLTLAFQLMAQSAPVGKEREVLDMIQELGQASGVEGMIGGQVADIINEGIQADADMLTYIHEHKTGALLAASVRIGAILAGVGEDELFSFTTYARRLGLAFQIVDDILDVTGEADKLGKAVGADAALSKSTYPSLYGLEESIRMVNELTEQALAALELLPYDTTRLKEIALYLLQRDH